VEPEESLAEKEQRQRQRGQQQDFLDSFHNGLRLMDAGKLSLERLPFKHRIGWIVLGEAVFDGFAANVPISPPHSKREGKPGNKCQEDEVFNFIHNPSLLLTSGVSSMNSLMLSVLSVEFGIQEGHPFSLT